MTKEEIALPEAKLERVIAETAQKQTDWLGGGVFAAVGVILAAIFPLAK